MVQSASLIDDDDDDDEQGPKDEAVGDHNKDDDDDDDGNRSHVRRDDDAGTATAAVPHATAAPSSTTLPHIPSPPQKNRPGSRTGWFSPVSDQYRYNNNNHHHHHDNQEEEEEVENADHAMPNSSTNSSSQATAGLNQFPSWHRAISLTSSLGSALEDYGDFVTKDDDNDSNPFGAVRECGEGSSTMGQQWRVVQQQ